MQSMDNSSFNSRLTPHVSQENGFTIIELLIVIALIGTMSAIAFPNFQEWLTRIRVNGAVRGLAMEMNLARVRAISENRKYWIDFSSSTQYKIYADSDRSKDFDVSKDALVKTVSLSSGIKFGTAAGVKKTSGSDDVPADGVTFIGPAEFGPDGRGNDGEVYLIPSADSAYGRKDRMRAMTISPHTYKVKVYRYTGSTWSNF